MISVSALTEHKQCSKLIAKAVSSRSELSSIESVSAQTEQVKSSIRSASECCSVQCIGMYSSLGCVVLQTFSEFGICDTSRCATQRLCCRRLGCHCVVSAEFGMCCVADCQGVCFDRYS